MATITSLSPTARLLRNSRLMSIPAPLKPGKGVGARKMQTPTHQVIFTPHSSQFRGDWGLKRPLPTSRTRSSSDYVRYDCIDTLEHRTTFESAADNVMTVKKWQEMDIPLANIQSASSELRPRGTLSAFLIDGDDALNQKDGIVWGYREEYLPALLPGQLKRYIDRKIKPQRSKFLEFVVARERKMRGEDSLESSEISLDAKAEYDVMALRRNPDILQKMVEEYFPLPLSKEPHRTHPSAGLHYTRNSGLMDNSPLTGPQENRTHIGRSRRNNQGDTLALVGGIVGKLRNAHFTGPLATQLTKTGLEISYLHIQDAQIGVRGEVQMGVGPVTSNARTAIANFKRDYDPKAVSANDKFLSEGNRNDQMKVYKPRSEIQPGLQHQATTEVATFYNNLLEMVGSSGTPSSTV